MKNLIDYAEAETIIRRSGIYTTAAEVYGLVMGLLAGGLKRTDKDYKELIINLLNDGDEIQEDMQHWISQIATFVLGEYLGRESMKLLLPDENAKPSERFQALSDMSRGFLTGFSCKQKRHDVLSSEAVEFIHDLTEFTRLVVSDNETSEEFESDYMILSEHISVGAQICFEECAGKLYPNEHANDFVLEDDDGGALAPLSDERKQVHSLEESSWEQKARNILPSDIEAENKE